MARLVVGLSLVLLTVCEDHLNDCQLTSELLVSQFGRGAAMDLTGGHGVALAAGRASGRDLAISLDHTQGGAESHGLDRPIKPIHSASKLVAALVMLRLVQNGILDLDAPVARVLGKTHHAPGSGRVQPGWWSNQSSDPRAGVSLRHLLAQTSGFGVPPGSPYSSLGASACVLSSRVNPLSAKELQPGELSQADCAKQIYALAYGHVGGPAGHPELVPEDVRPGLAFYFTSANMVLAVHLAEVATGERFPEIFRRVLAEPLGLSDECEYPAVARVIDGGTMLHCSTAELSRIMRAYYAGELLSGHWMGEMERPHTLEAVLPGYVLALYQGESWRRLLERGATVHYGLGVWVVCASPGCDEPPLVHHASGFDGVLPFFSRSGRFWGVLGREGGVMPDALGEELSMRALPALLRDIPRLYEECASSSPASADEDADEDAEEERSDLEPQDVKIHDYRGLIVDREIYNYRNPHDEL